MKKLLIIFLLSFSYQSLSTADDISDFEIEGMSIGDSLLDYVLEKEIKDNLAPYYKDKDYSSFLVYKNEGSYKLKHYDHFIVSFKTSDSKYKIIGLSGVIWHEKTIEKCYKQMKLVISDISQVLPKIIPKKIKTIDSQHGVNTYSRFDFKSGNSVTIQCTDYDDKYEFTDHLRVTSDTIEFLDWIRVKAYK